jgi:hypothetical protein
VRAELIFRKIVAQVEPRSFLSKTSNIHGIRQNTTVVAQYLQKEASEPQVEQAVAEVVSKHAQGEILLSFARGHYCADAQSTWL